MERERKKDGSAEKSRLFQKEDLLRVLLGKKDVSVQKEDDLVVQTARERKKGRSKSKGQVRGKKPGDHVTTVRLQAGAP